MGGRTRRYKASNVPILQADMTEKPICRVWKDPIPKFNPYDLGEKMEHASWRPE